MDFNPRRNYVMQWNFNIQREILPNTSIMLGYVGARGKHMRFQADDVNMVYPTHRNPDAFLIRSHGRFRTASPVDVLCPARNGRPHPPLDGSWPVVNQFMGRTQMALWDGSYSYNGLQVQVKKEMATPSKSKGLTLFPRIWTMAADRSPRIPSAIQFRACFGSAKRAGAACPMRINAILTINYDWNIPTPASFGRPRR